MKESFEKLSNKDALKKWHDDYLEWYKEMWKGEAPEYIEKYIEKMREDGLIEEFNADNIIDSKELLKGWKEKYLGSATPKRYVDDPRGGKTIFREDDPVKLRPIDTIQELFDDEVYQAIHRNRGLLPKHDRIIFAYCWIPVRKHLPGKKNYAEKLYSLRKEFRVEDIPNDKVPEFFEMLKEQYGDFELIIKRMIDDMEADKKPSPIAKKYKIWKGPEEGVDKEYAERIIEKYGELRKLIISKAKRREGKEKI